MALASYETQSYTGFNQPRGIAVSDDSNIVWVSNFGSGTAIQITVDPSGQGDPISLPSANPGLNPVGITIYSDNSVFIASKNGSADTPSDQRVIKISGNTPTVIRNGLGSPFRIVTTPNTVWVTSPASHSVYLIDISTNNIINTVIFNPNFSPGGIVKSDTAIFTVADYYSTLNHIYKIPIENQIPELLCDMGTELWGSIAISPDQQHLYVGARNNVIYRVTISTGAKSPFITVSQWIWTGFAISQYFMWVAGRDGLLHKILLSDPTQRETISLHEGQVVISPDFSSVWVTAAEGTTVTQVILPPPLFTVSGTSVPNNGTAALALTISPGQTIDLNTYVTASGGANYTLVSGTGSITGSIVTVPSAGILTIRVTSTLTIDYYVGHIELTLTVTIAPPPPPAVPVPLSVSLKALRNGVQGSGTTLTALRGGIELIKQAGEKQQKFGSYADYLRYKNAIPYVQNKSGQ